MTVQSAAIGSQYSAQAALGVSLGHFMPEPSTELQQSIAAVLIVHYVLEQYYLHTDSFSHHARERKNMMWQWMHKHFCSKKEQMGSNFPDNSFPDNSTPA